MKKLLRITTISLSLDLLLKGQLRFLNKHFEVVGIASGEELLHKVSEREGIRVINIPMEREINLVKDVLSLYKMIRVIHQEKPYIVHSNTPKGSLLAMVAAWICRVPHRVYTVTGLRFETETGISRKLLILMEQITCACATKVIPEGEGVKKSMLSERITQKPLKIIFNGNINGVDLDYFNKSTVEFSDKNKIKKDHSFTFVFIGRINSDKGINELISAFNRLTTQKSNHSGIKLLLVGSLETEVSTLECRTTELIKNNKQIEWIEGWQEDIRPYLAAADALVFPSYREGFPNVVLQAGAMGLPSIVTDINGCNEIIIESVNGIIIPPKNEDALYNAMLNFIQSPEKVKSMAENARGLIESRYEQKMLWQALLDEYKRMCQ